MRYPIAIQRATDTTVWGVDVPDLPGCFSAGDTVEDAVAQAKRAITAWIEAANVDRKTIPPPSATLLGRPEFIGWMCAGVEVGPAMSKAREPAHTRNAMNSREALGFLRAVDETRALTGMSEDYCIASVAETLGVPMPNPAMFRNMRLHKARVTRMRSRGRPSAGKQTKGEAFAMLATYFESIGAKPEQAITLAHDFLGFTVSRKVAKAEIDKYRGKRQRQPDGTLKRYSGTASHLLRVNAEFVMATMSRGLMVRRLPEAIAPAKYKRPRRKKLQEDFQTFSYLG